MVDAATVRQLRQGYDPQKDLEEDVRKAFWGEHGDRLDEAFETWRRAKCTTLKLVPEAR